MIKIDHAALFVEDLERARLFFERYFGGKSNSLYHNAKTGFESYFISFGDGARLEIMRRPDMQKLPKPQFRTGFSHIALSVGSAAEVESLTNRLLSDGYKVISNPRITGDGCYESSVMDFEGNLIEITV